MPTFGKPSVKNIIIGWYLFGKFSSDRLIKYKPVSSPAIILVIPKSLLSLIIFLAFSIFSFVASTASGNFVS
jgi:hypothetical protein